MKDNLDHASTSGFFEALDYEAANMVRTAQTLDHKEGLRAFVEKRRPSFNGH
jgi:enoyl-CoA hydratase/carnithine racemase